MRRWRSRWSMGSGWSASTHWKGLPSPPQPPRPGWSASGWLPRPAAYASETGYRWRFRFEQERIDAAITAATEALGSEAASAAAAEGAMLDWQEAASYAARARGERKRPSHGWAALTPTEQQVVALVAEGLTNPQIAERLLMGRATVKTHLDHVFAKTGLHSRTELAAEFVRRHPNTPG